MDIRIDTPNHPDDPVDDECFIYAPMPDGEGEPEMPAPYESDFSDMDADKDTHFPQEDEERDLPSTFEQAEHSPFVTGPAQPYTEEGGAAGFRYISERDHQQLSREEAFGSPMREEDVMPSNFDEEDTAQAVAYEVPSEPEIEMVPKKEYDAIVDRYERLMSDWDNYRRRSAEDVAAAKDNANRNLAESLVPTLDHFGFALEHASATEDPAVQGMFKGFEAIYRALIDSLSREGMSIIAPEPGSAFDMMEHQAVESVPDTGMESDSIVKVVQPGYKFKDYIIRPAMVAVSL